MRRPADKERSHGISFFTNHRRRNSELQDREDDRFYAFLDINPLAEGHTLVVPKCEVDYIFDLDDRTLGDMMLFAKKVAAAIRRETGSPQGRVIVLGLEVPHAHIHLIPMNEERDVDFSREKLQLTPERFASIAERLREAVEI